MSVLQTGNFVDEKIDIKMFGKLTAEDLLKLKINTFGARKRLLFAIDQLNAETTSFSESRQLPDFKDIPSLFAHLEMGHHIGNQISFSLKKRSFSNYNDTIFFPLNN